MFGNKDNKSIRTPENGQGSINIIGVGTEINGDVTSTGDIRIDGNISGKIISKAKVVIGASSVIKGDIEAQNADVSGKVNGKIHVTETLFIKQTAIINGDITVNKLVVESGGEFNGNCIMLSSKKPHLNGHNNHQDGKSAPKTVLQTEEAGV